MKLFYTLFPVLAPALVIVPQPDGPYGVSLQEIQLNDTTRVDPYTGKPFRLLPVTVIAPTGPSSSCQSSVQQYMSNATAQYWERILSEEYKEYDIDLENTFSQMRLSLCAPQKTKHQYPTIFFSQGSQFPAQLYRILTTNLAAQGYVVVQVGIPGEIDFIQFPDGHIERGHVNLTAPSAKAAALDVRVKDIGFVLDQLSASQAISDCMDFNMNTSSPSIFGHSFGGSTSLATLIADDRFVAGVNIDGAFWGDDLVNSTHRPFMIVASTPNYTRDISTVPNWAETWPHLYGPKWLVSVRNTTHDSFVDTSLVAQYFGLSKNPVVREVIGQINSEELLKIQVTLLTAMAEFGDDMISGQNVTNTAAELEDVDVLNMTLSSMKLT